MKKIVSAAFCAHALMFVSLSNQVAMADQTTGSVTPPGACQDLVIVMKDDSGDVANPKKMTVFLDCHEASANLPSGTTMNFFVFDQGRLCHGYRVCGNLSGWEGNFRVGSTWYYGRNFGDAFNVADNCNQEDGSCHSTDFPYSGYGFGYPGYNGYPGYPGYGSYNGRSNVRLDFVTKFSHIDRHCGQLHNYQCLELPSLPSAPHK
ncbi:hypothetical protein EBR21_10680 [bacterium]|nr:hypothetical protein [bacterium]